MGLRVEGLRRNPSPFPLPEVPYYRTAGIHGFLGKIAERFTEKAHVVGFRYNFRVYG